MSITLSHNEISINIKADKNTVQKLFKFFIKGRVPILSCDQMSLLTFLSLVILSPQKDAGAYKNFGHACNNVATTHCSISLALIHKVIIADICNRNCQFCLSVFCLQFSRKETLPVFMVSSSEFRFFPGWDIAFDQKTIVA